MSLLAGRPEAASVKRMGVLAVRRFGAGAPLVLIHGGMGSWTHWIANIPGLGSRFGLMAIDLPGFGDAPAPLSRQPDDYLDDVAEALSKLLENGAPAGIVGFSFGAVVAAAAARRLPQQVAGLSLLGPGGFGSPTGRVLAVRPLPDMADDPEGHRAAIAFNLGQFMLSRAPDPDEPAVAIQTANIARARFDSRTISHQNRLLEDMVAIACPVQVVWGELDRLAYPSISARAELCRRARHDAQIAVVSHAGHWVQYEAAEQVDSLLIGFHSEVSK
jgi:pimeloyl-ACP methyl ester carboxylesterase